MSYGVTSEGFVKKRLDEIIAEMQLELSNSLGIDVASNPQSALNALITNFSGRIAELWDTAEATYYAQFPASAEGINLDNAVAFSGLSREAAKKSRYIVSCVGTDGTLIPSGSRVTSITTPAYNFDSSADAYISRLNATVIDGSNPSSTSISQTTYKITIDGTELTVVDASGALWTMLGNMATAINNANLGVTASTANSHFTITASDLTIPHVVTYNAAFETVASMFGTRSVASPISFYSETYGEVVVPSGSITVIGTAITGWTSCVDVGSPELGRLTETDVELRLAYARKKASRASMNIEAIADAVATVGGVTSVSCLENVGDTTSAEGIPAHCIEVVAMGGDNVEIARKILQMKPAGIATYGSVTVPLSGTYAGTVNICFARPTAKTIWIKVLVRSNGTLPTNYETLIKNAIMKKTFEIGETVYTQSFIPQIIEDCINIAYVDIYACTSATTPSATDYTERMISVTKLEYASLDTARIEVVPDND